MSRRRAVVAIIPLAGAVVLAVLLERPFRPRPVTLTGAVIRQDADPAMQAPVPDVSVTAADGLAVQGTISDASGKFRLMLRPGVKSAQMVTLLFNHPGYKPLLLTEPIGERLYIARMAPIPTPEVSPELQGPAVHVANVTVRYTLRTASTESVGTAVKTFEVAGTNNVPCNGPSLCSPDGRWKAAAATLSLDAGEGNEFRRPRASCIAGPCPFTKIDSDELSKDSRTLTVVARNWSATATFLVQAEVVRTGSENVVRRLYPLIFGKDLTFTLPAEAEGSSIEAEVGGTAIVFPLGPALCLTWADCQLQTDQNQNSFYRCELKPGYQFH